MGEREREREREGGREGGRDVIVTAYPKLSLQSAFLR